MQEIGVGLIGLGNVGSGTLQILNENAEQIAGRLGFALRVAGLSSRSVHEKGIRQDGAVVSADWREVVADPRVEVVAELIGGTTVAREVIETSLRLGKPVVTANKELMALAGPELVALATQYGTVIAMEASVAGGIPIHTVLREGISGDRVQGLYGILNGTSNFILSEIEERGAAFGDVLAEAQRLGYAEADPTADIEGFDARSKLAILTALAFGGTVSPEQIYREGITRVSPLDFAYAKQLGCTIRLLCTARRPDAGLQLAVRPSLIPLSNILSSVRGAYNAVFVRGEYGKDTFYYGRGAGPQPTGVAVVSDLMRLAADLRGGSLKRTATFGFRSAASVAVDAAEQFRSPFYLRFRVQDQVGIIAKLASILAGQGISIDAILQLPSHAKDDLPFVVTVDSCTQQSLQAALNDMQQLSFLKEAPLAMPIESAL